MISETDRQGAVRPKRAASDGHRDRERSPRWRTEADQPYLHRRHPEVIDDLPAGKRQMMERFFTPVHSPPLDGNKARGQRQVPDHQHQHRSQDKETHSYSRLGDNDVYITEGSGQHLHHGQHLQNDQEPVHKQHRIHHPHHRFHNDEMLDHNTTVILSRASSSSLSSSSSRHSSNEWSSEPSIADPFSLQHASRLQHTMSCSNIAAGRQFREDDSEPQAFATVKLGRKPGGGSPGPQSAAQGRGAHQPNYAALNRGHSRSDEGLLQNAGTERGKERTPPHLKHGRLYKTASLGRSLAFSEEILAGPKRAVSSIQLPSKGILKNKEARLDIRKAKSMEVLSPRVAGKADTKGKQDVESLRDAARQNMLKGKIQFSAFLDEITKQVICPARLNTLGVPVETVGPGPTKAPASPKSQPKIQPQLPSKKQGDGQAEEREPATKPQALSRKLRNESDQPTRKVSLPLKFGYESMNYTSCPGSPPMRFSSQAYPLHPPQGYEDQPATPPDVQGPVGDRHGRHGSVPTDGMASSSPEPSHHKRRGNKHRDRSNRPSLSPPPSPNTQLPHRTPVRTHSPPPVPGPESESPSSKCSSLRNRDQDMTSPSSEQSDRHSCSIHHWHHKTHRALMGDTGEFQALQEENTELHQNLMQAVVCIESLEAELARTREELSHIKEKFKRMQETHTDTQHTNSFLGEKLHSATESLASERKYMQQRIAHLSSELEQANATIASLENINVPCLIKELLEKHFDSGDAVKQFLRNALKTGQSTDNSQSNAQKVEEKTSDRGGAGAGEFESDPPRVTAFLPWKHKEEGYGGKRQTENADFRPISPPFSVADISIAVYKKIAASHTARQPINYQLRTDTSRHTCPSVELSGGGQGYAGHAARGAVGGPGRAAENDQDGAVDVSYLAAQRVLDDFMHRLTHPEDGNGGVGRGHMAD